MESDSISVKQGELIVANTAPTFVVANGKLVVQDFGGRVIQQSDGKLLIEGAGASWSDFSLVRLNSDGSLDATFGLGGKLLVPFGQDSYFVDSVIQQIDGKLVVAGTSENRGNGYDLNFGLIRLNSDGSLDHAFGIDGKQVIQVGPSYDYVNSVFQQTDGKLVIAGTSYSSDLRSSDFSLVRLNGDGNLDSSFGIGGKMLVPVGSGFESVVSVIQQADGKVVMVGHDIGFNSGGVVNPYMIRLNSDGSVDSTFGSAGMLALFDVGIETNYRVIQQNDGKLLAFGVSQNAGNREIIIRRLESDGSLDISFGANGKQVLPVDVGYLGINSVIQQVDGRLLVAGAGTRDNGDSRDFSLVRLNSDGGLDDTFGSGGKLLVSVLSNYDDYVSSIVQQSDGKLVVVGSSYNSSNSSSYFSLVRLNTDGSLDENFGPRNTLQNLGPALFTEGMRFSTILAPEAQISDAELLRTGAYGGASLTVARQGGAKAEDVFSSSGTMTALNLGSYFAVDGITIGRVTANGSGTLVLAFNSNATQDLVNKAMQQIAYVNTSDAPPSTVAIDWTFNDGNTGAQGVGGALSVTNTSFVVITGTNDAPYLAAQVPNQRIAADRAFNFQLPFVDPDLELLTYTVTMADGTGVPPWLNFNRDTQSFSGTPTANDLGTFNFTIRVTDAAGKSAQGLLNITVYENIAPVLANALEDRSVTLGANLNFALPSNTFSDIDNASLTYTATLENGSTFPSWLKFDSLTRTFSGMPGATDLGRLSIQVTASDGLLSASDIFSLVVSDYFEPVVDQSNIATYTRSANQYTIRFDPVSQDLLVTDTDPQRYEVRKFTDAKRIEFADLTLNFAVSDLAITLPEPALNRIAELYVAFFNRIPDGDGMEFWLGEYRQGKSINDIADAFYNAGVFFSDLTGYRADMSNDDFINIVYRNVLGRPEGADQDGLAFWRAELDSGRSAKGTLVSSILDAAHGSTFSDPTNPYHWVQKLLDNKLEVAKQVSVDWGVNYNSSGDSIAKGQAIAAAITPDDTSVAISLVGVVVADLV